MIIVNWLITLVTKMLKMVRNMIEKVKLHKKRETRI